MNANKKALAAVPLALMMVVGLNTQAEAVTKTWSSKTYSETFTSFSTPLQKCIVVTLTGKMEYRWWKKREGVRDIWVDRIRLKDPKMTMSIKGQCGRHGAPQALSKASMSQRFYDSGCKTSTAITVSAPFAVGVTPTQKCGRLKTAKRSTSYSADSSTYTQFNTGRPATFSKTIGVVPVAGREKVCMRADAVYTAYKGQYSDSFSKSANVCVKAFNV